MGADCLISGAFIDLFGETTPKGLVRSNSGEKSNADDSWTDAKIRTRMDVMEFMVVFRCC